MNKIGLTVLVENTAKTRGMLGEHGLSYWIETASGCVLFDTGQGQALLPNSQKMGIDLTLMRALVISHGHYDHVGALPEVLSFSPEVPVYLHKDALLKRFSKAPDGSIRNVNTDYMESLCSKHKAICCYVSSPQKVLPGLYMTGPVPRKNDYEDTGGDFYLDAEGTQCDPITDDQSLFFESDQGWVVILGCAHAGVINTLDYIAEQIGVNRFHSVIGGMHLLNADTSRIQKTIKVFEKYQVAHMGPCHCTGIRAVSAFWEAFPERCVEVYAGKYFEFKTPERQLN